MLKSQDAVPETQSVSPVSVSQARVTPDELTQALAAIEARRQAEASRLAETIPIDQAVSELHLDSTSDEIWAEVQAQRAKATAAQEAERQEIKRQTAKQQEAEQQEARPRTGIPPLQMPRLRAIPSPWSKLPADRARMRRRGWRRLLAPALVVGVLMGAGVIPRPWSHHASATAPQASTDAPTLRPLSTVPDGSEVFADDAALSQISKGKPTSQVSVSQDPDSVSWPLVKMHGHVYLRGFTVRADSLTALAGKALPVYNDDDSGEFHRKATSNITLRIDGVPLEKSGGDGDYSSIIVPSFQPDSFTTLTPGR